MKLETFSRVHYNFNKYYWVGWEPGEPIPKEHPKQRPVGHVGRVWLVAQVPGGCLGKGLAGHMLVHCFVASGLGEHCEGNETKN